MWSLPERQWRSLVVGEPAGCNDTTVADAPAEQAESPRARPRRAPSRQLWADLMRRSFGFDVLACPRCGGRLRLIALIEQATVIERIRRHLGLPTAIPEPRARRAADPVGRPRPPRG